MKGKYGNGYEMGNEWTGRRLWVQRHWIGISTGAPVTAANGSGTAAATMN